MSTLLFQMWEPFRETLIAEHRFYVEQARKRLLSQFENIESEADRAAKDHLEKMSARFDPDRHDPSDFYEAAHDKGIEFYQLLSDMQESVRLSVIAGMFHQWDKQLRDWIVREMRHWHLGVHATESVWAANFSEVMGLLAGVGFDAKTLPCHEHLNAMRLVVNVFKHGAGASLDELKATFPEFVVDGLCVDDELRIPITFLDHTHLRVSEAHIDVFSEAILAFWQAVPEKIWWAEGLTIPKRFEKAVLRDREAQ